MGIADQLFTQFPGADKQEWQEVAKSEIGEGKSLESLSWNIQHKLPFAPYYDLHDLHAIRYLQKFDFPDTSSEFNLPRDWKNVTYVAVTDEKTANDRALNHLKQETEGILFHLPSSKINFDTLLDKIEWPYCTVSFLAPDNFSFQPLNEYIRKKKYSNLSGAIFQRSPEVKENELIQSSGLNALGVFIESASPIQEIVTALREGVRILDLAVAQKISLTDTLNAIAFSIPVTGELLVNVSKLKALRFLWFQVAQAYGASHWLPEQLHMHTRSEWWMDEKYQPHGNMLKSTVASLAAVAGGTNSHTVFIESESDAMQNRIARNISVILKEESHFGKVADPLAGSYIVENMVHAMAKAAWEEFRNKE